MKGLMTSGCFMREGDISSLKGSRLCDVALEEVTVTDEYERNSFSLEVKYLKSLEGDRLLRGFCDIAGIESDSPKYGGWETSSIQGHTLGHYLTAVSQAYAASGDKELLGISQHIVSVLRECQDKNSGYLAAIPQEHYLKIEQGNTSGTWVPWYTMHKVLSGLIDAYELTDNGEALFVAENLGNWVFSRSSSWDEETQRKVLNVEYGGMNDCLYRLYSHTKNKNHLSAAHSFDEISLFTPLSQGEDILCGKHANTTIPKILGALRRYIVLGQGEEFYLKTAEGFWDIVASDHSYITGGNSEWEHFGESRILDAERTNCNCETCNTYNMLKLTKELFKLTGKRKYADYYESTYINAILSSQNPETGMTTYFQPMAAGFFKVYSSATEHFWCCTGSGMENFSKPGEGVYFKNDDSLYITRYVSSEVLWKEKDLRLIQKATLPEVNITFRGSGEAELVMRKPCWCREDCTLEINGRVQSTDPQEGFIRLKGQWNDGDTIRLVLPMKIIAYGLPDSENTLAFSYGPYVLSADMGRREMETSTTGVNVTVPLADGSVSDIVRVNNSLELWLKNPDDNFERQADSFCLKNTDRDLVFSPHYRQHKSRYGIYLRFYSAGEAIPKDESEDYATVDSLPVGNDQYEFSHSLLCSSSASGNHRGFVFRDAAPEGFFSYKMQVDPKKQNYLFFKVFSGDKGREFYVVFSEGFTQKVEIKETAFPDFYDVYLKIPREATRGKKSIDITFKAGKQSPAGGIFHRISTLIKKEQ